MSMTRVEILEKFYNISVHNLFCCSANYAMTKPRKGYEKDFQEANEIVECLSEMIEELK